MRSWVEAFGVVTLAAAVACGQSTLPPTPPTQLAAPSAEGAAPPAAPAHRAQVSYQLGQLTVIAENSSLDQILRDVASQTGMKITGGVADQQVYGTYGPAAPAVVLGRLLEGSGANMVLRETASNQPTELIITPSEGGPAAPSVNNPASAYTPPQPPATYHSASQPPYNAAPPNVPAPPSYSAQPPSQAPPQVTPAQTAPALANPQSPNGVLTPQQIYEQLQQLQRQRPQPPGGSQ